MGNDSAARSMRRGPARKFIRELGRLLFSDASLLRWTAFSVLSFGFVTVATIALNELTIVGEKPAFAIPLAVVFFWNFITMRYFVYGRPTRSIRKQFVEYCGAAVLFRCLEFLVYWFCIDVIGVYYAVAVLVILPTSFIAKFLFFKVAIFGSRGESSCDRNVESGL